MIDIAVVLGYFALILSVGLYLGRKEDSLSDFALGGRSLPWWAVLGSIIAAETSAGTFIGTPGEGYSLRNYTFLQIVFGMIIARVLVAFVFIKPYYDAGVFSIYEYLTLRFGTRTKNAASATFLVTRLLASGTRLYIAAVILAVGAKLLFPDLQAGGKHELLIYLVATTLLTILTAIYTAFGGIKAVIWTDMIQAVIMLGSGLGAIVFLYMRIPGGWEGIGQHLNGFADVTFISTGVKPGSGFWTAIRGIVESPYTIWAGLIASTFTTMGTHGTDQDMVQRMLTAKDFKRSRLSLILSGIMDLPIVAIFVTIGILLYVFYQAHPDPGLPRKTNEIFCYFILKEMPAGMRGLMIAGIFATTMGSLSAALNALATSFIRDWYEPYFARSGGAGSLRAARWTTVAFAVLMVAVASGTSYAIILFPTSRLIPVALGVLGYTYGSLLGVFLLGMLTRERGSDFGNLAAMVLGFVVVALLSGVPQDLARLVGQSAYQQPAWLPVIAFPWRILVGTVVTFSAAACFRTERVRSPSEVPSLVGLSEIAPQVATD